MTGRSALIVASARTLGYIGVLVDISSLPGTAAKRRNSPLLSCLSALLLPAVGFSIRLITRSSGA
ncbi:hypothetical protein QUF31_02190 [Dickeya chrysanthemi]|uniref:hypothetical protein n=1 Tax=Dickeya chrysanthemi TaxID=556 RepID=UPI0025A0C3A7|nr:hypothetical protein [Dickeya chrysanthemi]WJM85961.1 hypothetical protein QUF31_02190 [Dickeya chrysanthemi]